MRSWTMSPVYAFLTGHLKPAVLISRVHVVFIFLPLALLYFHLHAVGRWGFFTKEKRVISFLVCLSLWHLNKPEKCINLAKDWSQSDGWAGISPHSSFSVFIAINFKSGNRLQEHGVLGRKFAHLWLMGISITSLLPWLSELRHR